MTNRENEWDKLLQIKTDGRDETNADEYHHPYEPTSYSVLERLTNSGSISKDDVVLDYGCGKGRVGFFLSYRAKAKKVMVEWSHQPLEKLHVRGQSLKTLGTVEDWSNPVRSISARPFRAEFIWNPTTRTA